MERASQALARMDYLECEALCIEALTLARQSQLWDYYARILLPLQESRRHRRMIAAEGCVRLGTSLVAGDVAALLSEHPAGCIVLTPPHTADDARRLQQAARDAHLFVEILLAAPHADDARWTLRTFSGPAASCSVPRPPAAWIDAWQPASAANPESPTPPHPADWFIDASESLGDELCRQVAAPMGSVARVLELEHCLAAVTDHEILHQRLSDAARAVSSSNT